MTQVDLTPQTLSMLKSEYGPITVPHSSLEDLANALLQRYVQTVRDAKRMIDEHSPVACG